MSSEQPKKSFKDTLNLPRTDFSIRANAKEKEPAILKKWQDEEIYKKAVAHNKESKNTFVLHDGPPFANGHMHVGHMLNRVLKDIVCKSKRMSGDHVVSVPGWDCHGLPIELKVAGDFKGDKETPEGRKAFKKLCRDYAKKWIETQKEEVKRLGVVTDWDNPYITMSPQYEAAILKSFATFVEKGYIERKGKTVPWCASCQTVLATAEIEHKDRKDPSCYILFPFDSDVAQKLFSEVLQKKDLEEVGMLIWTTTPWTIPLNRAVVVHPKAKYVLLEGENKKAFVVGAELADELCKTMGIKKNILATFDSTIFKNQKVAHPYIEDLFVPIILDDSVLLTDGTACVHSAPGCGPEDYFLGVKNGLEIFSPLSADGKYTEGIQPKDLEDMSIEDGQIWSIRKMHSVGRLIFKNSCVHSYPHCWRCQKGLMFRATDQWFCNLEKDNLVKNAVVETEKISFIPEWGKNRLVASMQNRTEWCLSRQRQWGVAIPALLCKKCEHPFLDATFIRSVAKNVEKEGIEYWDGVTIQDMQKEKMISESFVCEKCKNADLNEFRKEYDILDVWFESGISHDAVKELYPDFRIPADLYLEGSDQHRGWFQSSLLGSMIVHNQTCTQSFLTHGFVLDEAALKMSKSKGNVVSPQKMIDKYSADIMRLWVASADFEGDVSISENIVKSVSEVYRKVRNTCRFLISNLYDFDFKKDAVALEDMFAIDQQALAQLQNVNKIVTEAYESYKFTSVFHTINNYCINDLSSFYLDILKDRLYTEKSDGKFRRSAQTAMYHILDTLTKLIAPVLTFTAEDISNNYQKDKNDPVFLQRFPEVIDIWKKLERKTQEPAVLENLGRPYGMFVAKEATFEMFMIGCWNSLQEVRDVVLKAIEGKRETGVVKHSLEAKVKLYLEETNEKAKVIAVFIDYLKTKGEDANRFFKDFFIVSQFELAVGPSKPWRSRVETQDGLNETSLDFVNVLADHADGEKCPRCWHWDTEFNADGLCRRCQDILK